MKALPRIMSTLAAGLLGIGLLIGFANQLGECGSAFSGEKESPCAEFRAENRPLPMALIGLGVTLLAAAIVTQSLNVTEQMNSEPRSTPPSP